MRYGIHPHYVEQPAHLFEPYDDRHVDDSLKWQREVYEWARRLFIASGYGHVVDFGCGTGDKLVAYFDELPNVRALVGIEETAEKVRFCYSRHHDRKISWLRWNEWPKKTALAPDLIICADVIEHVERPDRLLQFLRDRKAERYIFSTPARERLRRKLGPPTNRGHWREWETEEFVRLLGDYGFEVLESRLLSTSTQTHLCA